MIYILLRNKDQKTLKTLQNNFVSGEVKTWESGKKLIYLTIDGTDKALSVPLCGFCTAQLLM